MRAWFPFVLLAVSVFTVITFTIVTFQLSLHDYVTSTTMRDFIYGGMMLITFLPAVSLIVAILGHSTKYRTLTVAGSSIWLAYWLGILTLYTLTKGR